MKDLVETNYASTELKTVYEWIQRKFGVMQKISLKKPEEINAKVDDADEINENRYSPKYIVRLLKEKYPKGKAIFYFSSKNDYITVSSNGHLNVRGGEEDMFRAWGISEFRNFKPQFVFQELEKELIKIIVTPASNGEYYSFNSYNELISWLARHEDKN
ncbi:MAG TPA: hypothetical protein VHT73_19350 [Thermodesulfobacteriota bacterium]|nr:hypothetical protein [Thermodesulfobacteriota bacterium]